jgi:hypothetical protein
MCFVFCLFTILISDLLTSQFLKELEGLAEDQTLEFVLEGLHQACQLNAKLSLDLQNG